MSLKSATIFKPHFHKKWERLSSYEEIEDAITITNLEDAVLALIKL